MTIDTERSPANPDEVFWKLFSRVLKRPVDPGSYTRDELPEWDSLRHVELIFELEEAFGVNIDAEDIVELYSSPQAILDYLREHG
ncbi:MAG: acyl carrier protein [Pseudomonadales bacterium]|nr:acyl carrier protein [Pseudomonadales bacterium]